jgi:ABC-type multidrug transport system fused ATPase/permease subunit
MSKPRIFLKAFWISIKIKGAVSIIVSLLGFPMALLPVLLAGQLRELTDQLQLLTGVGGSPIVALRVFAIIVVLYIAGEIFNFIKRYVNRLDSLNIEKYIKKTILQYKCEVRYKYIENTDDFQKKIAFAEQYAGERMASSTANLISLLQLLVTLVGIVAVLWPVNAFIVAIIFVTSVPAAVLAYFQQEENFRSRTRLIEEGSMAIHYFYTTSGGGYSFNCLQEIHHFGLYDYIKARWRAIADDYIGKQNKILKKHVKFNTAADFLRSGVYIGILMMTAWEIYQDPTIGLGVFTLVFALSGQLQSVTGNLLSGSMVLAQSIPYMNEFFNLEEFERESCAESSETIKSGDITFQNVDFSYPNTEVDALKKITVRIKDGEKVAVVGENGSGKSTFISLLCGMFDPKTGYIAIGEIDISVDPAVARGAVSVVFQDFARYEASLRENITVSEKNRNVNDEEIMELLREININDVIEEQPNRLDEIVGSFSEKANNLSGGQWQKISIARAAYRQSAKIMVLDEPTSALDPVAEAQLYRNFASLTRDKTTILISHRLGITAIVDRILVFKDGEIIEDGSHKELMKQNGHYAEMYRAQAQWYQ